MHRIPNKQWTLPRSNGSENGDLLNTAPVFFVHTILEVHGSFRLDNQIQGEKDSAEDRATQPWCFKQTLPSCKPSATARAERKKKREGS